MSLQALEEADSIADYLRSCGLTVIEREEDDMLEVKGSYVNDDGEVAWLVVDPDDVGDIIGDVYRANTDIEKVFEEYVDERIFR